ncbi:MAG: hypothetical protein MR601_05950 [Erysipelotrichaceae bacterium]|nr:hypothetical protein [Erysipelotrichaceae bacterium]
MIKNYRILSFISALISIVILFLLNVNKREYYKIVLDINKDMEVNTDVFVSDFKKTFETSGKFKVFILNKEDYLEKKKNDVNKINPDMIISFDNNYVFYNTDKADIYANFKDDKSTKFANILSDKLISEGILVEGVFYPSLIEIKSNTFNFKKFDINNGEIPKSLDTFDSYSNFLTVVVGNQNFENNKLHEIYFNAICEYFEIDE